MRRLRLRRCRRFCPSSAHRLGAVVVAIVGVLLYAQTLGYAFVYDDFPLIRDNKVTQQGFESVLPSFAQPFRFDNMRGVDYLYRPLTKAIFCATWGVFGNNPAPFHAWNILLHAATAAIVVAFVGHLLRGARWVSLATGLLFVVHPMHTEVVCNVKRSRRDFFALLFGLLGMLAWMRHRDAGREGTPWWGVAAFAAALFSKESAVTYVAAFAVLDHVRTRASVSAMRRGWIWLGIAVGVFLVARQAVLSNESYLVSPADNALLAVEDPLVRKASAVAYLGLYLKLLLFPYPLSADYSIPQLPLFGPADPQFLLSAAVWTAVVIAAVIAWRRRSLRAFGSVFLLSSMSVSSNLVFMIGTVFGERFGVFRVARRVSSRLVGRRPRAATGGIRGASNRLRRRVRRCRPRGVRMDLSAIARLEGLRCSPQGHVGHGAEQFPRAGVLQRMADRPRADALHVGRGEEGGYRGSQEASPARGGALPRSDQAWTMLGDIERRAGNVPAATIYYEKALAAEHTHPFYAKALNNLGTFYAEKNRIDDAIVLFQKAAKFEDSSSHAWSNLGKAWYVKGNMAEAATAFRKAIAFDPKDPDALRFLPLIAKAGAPR
jgi:hypothetical protein